MVARDKIGECGRGNSKRMLTYEVTSPAHNIRLPQSQSHRKRNVQNVIQHQQEPLETRLQPQQRRNVVTPIQTAEPHLETQTQQSGHHSSAASCTEPNKHVRGKYKCMKVDMKTRNGKLEVYIPDDILRVVGDNARDVVNYCGYIVRNVAPLFVEKENGEKEMVKVYASWGDVVNTAGEQMWIQVKEKFNVPFGQENRFHGFVLSTLQRLYRCWKNRLHQIYKKFKTDEERLANIPTDVNFEDWELLIQHFGSNKFQKVSKRNIANRSKLVTKHTCGTRSFVEVEESTRDPLTGDKAPPDEVWLLQHTKKDKEGNLRWSDPKSREVHEKLHDLVTQQPEDQESQLTRDEMLLQVLGEKPGYFRGKGVGKKAPSKRARFQENMQEEVQKAVELAKEKIIADVRADVENIRGEMRVNANEDIRAELIAELRPQIEEQLKEDIRAQMQSEFNVMFQERMAAFFNSMSQSRPSHSVDSNRDT